jgi:hypothetical protein
MRFCVTVLVLCVLLACEGIALRAVDFDVDPCADFGTAIHLQLCTSMRVACSSVLMAVGVCMYVCMYVCMCVCVCVCVCVDIHWTAQYACGAWIANTTLPPSEPIIVESFSAVEQHNYGVLQNILTSDKYSSQRMHTFYANCMDTATIEKLGITPLLTYWNQLGEVRVRSCTRV